MKDPKKNNVNGQPEEGTNRDVHLTNQDVSLINSSDNQPEPPVSTEKAADENLRQTKLDRESSPEFCTDPFS